MDILPCYINTDDNNISHHNHNQFVSCHFAFEKDLAKIESSGPEPIDTNQSKLICMFIRPICVTSDHYRLLDVLPGT